MPRSVAFKTPSIAYNYESLIEALARCREEVVRFQRDCGNRTPLYHEAQAVIFDVEALAKLLPADAVERVIQRTSLHSTRSTGTT